MKQQFFTAQELADLARDLRIGSFPQTKRGVNTLAKREGWNDFPVSSCRKCAGQQGGGGREYHINLLSEDFRTAIQVRFALSGQSREIVKSEAQRSEVLARTGVVNLKARQRIVMESRSGVLLALRGYRIAHGLSMASGVRAFMAAQDELAAFCAAEQVRDTGGNLNLDQVALLGREPVLLAPLSEGFGLTAKTLAQANDRRDGSPVVSDRTIRRWSKIYAEQGVAGLAPAVTKAVEPLPVGFETFLNYYARPTKPCMTEALKDYHDNLTEPSQALTLKQVRHTLKVKLNDIERNVGREGLLTLRSRMAFVRRSTDNLLPTTVYTADGKTFDAEIADWKTHQAMKPEITSILDVATRKCVGFALSRKEDTRAVTEALRNSCVDHGIPAIFYTDRGSGYKNKAMDDTTIGLMGRLSITKMHALPYNSQAKGIIERFNRTVWNPLAQKLPSYLGAGMDKEAKHRFHKATRADLKEFGQSRLLTPWADFLTMCQEAVARYNDRPHDGLPRYQDPATGTFRHLSPNEAWAQHVTDGFEPVPVDEDIQDDLFRPYEIRVARRAEVQWNTNTYFHLALEAYHGEQVLVGYDHSDAKRVWVRELDRTLDQPGKLICVARFAGNRTDYIPRTAQRAAEEGRAKGRMARIGNKIRDIDAELNRPYLVEQVDPLSVPLTNAPVREPVSLKVVGAEDTPALPQPARRRTFASDEELAAWVLINPEEMTSKQADLLRGCLRRESAREVFRMSGIDVEALRTLLRTAVA
ncbi:Mu transposase C-terminal domain-containing protein [Puniceibacterium sp. IMCC21224]|uniref:Mu transposase C-terminal domain-containing protein n=1 Tax=Puniceibacterium sp. IMCC21224 TaxID=1618204 RepID=UPI00064D8B9F|nr:Mu transposase C-terminal domain-containing protein [Puniceibacterium sp. IMCC21224]KMK68555.1 integrase family protein [Puniceibacterium sp. IMCC21224]